jgi:nucleoid-associated protein YgaU
MALEKAAIINEDTGEKIELCFNPSEVQSQKVVPWSRHPVKGTDSPEAQFTQGGELRLSMELLFDTYETQEDVRAKYLISITKLTEINPKLKRPPLCTFMWGQGSLKGFLESYTIRYTMFLEDGTAVRAVMNISIVQYTPAKQAKQARANPGPADRTKRRTVQQGDSLALIAAKEYGEPRRWRPIAEANGIDNPRILRPGQQLVIPPVE